MPAVFFGVFAAAFFSTRARLRSSVFEYMVPRHFFAPQLQLAYRLLEDVWGYERYPTTRTVDAHIVRLRQKIETKPEDPRFILTVHGVGYKFVG